MKPLYDDPTMAVIKTVMFAADGRISRDEMVIQIARLNSNDESMSTWKAIQYSWQANWISGSEFEQIINGGEL